MIKKKNKTKLITRGLILVLFACLISLAGSAKAGFGITPPYLKSDNLMRGMRYDQRVTVGADNLPKGSRVRFEVNVPGVNNWISIDKGVEVPFPAGKNTIDVVISVNVPMDAEYKSYKGVITAKTVPSDLAGGGVALSVGGEIGVDFTVTNEKIKDFEIRSYKIPDISEGENLKLVLSIRNKGNIEIAPSKVVLDVYDSDKKELLSSLNSIDIKGVAKPSEEGQITIEMPTSSLKQGSYWGKLKIFNDTKVVGEFNVSVGISEKNTVKVDNKTGGLNGFLSMIGLGGVNSYLAYAIIIVAVLILIILALKIVRRKNKREQKKLKK